MPKHRYLSKDVLDGFDNYKYSCVDTNPLAIYVCHPFWNWFVQLYPRWLAPNLITLSGFLLLVVAAIVLTIFDPDFYAASRTHTDSPAIPNWVWLFCGLCNFFSHTLDGTDGKQARRTGTSSPLGELFDHGLDSWATVFFPTMLYSIYGRGEMGVNVTRVFFCLMSVQLVFIMSHWEKYNTNILFLPWGYDISQVSMTFVYALTFFGTFEMWKFHVPYLGWSSAECFELALHIGSLGLSVPMTIFNIIKSYRDRTGKMHSFYELMLPLFPTFVLFSSFSIWGFYTHYDVLEKYPRLFYFTSGTVFSNITCRLIVNQMSNTRCEVFSWLLVPLVPIVAVSVAVDIGVYEYYLLWGYCVAVVLSHLHYGICVVEEMAEHFNINAFSITKPLPKESHMNNCNNHVISNGKHKSS